LSPQCVTVVALSAASTTASWRPKRGWNLRWRDLRKHQNIGSSGEVNWLIDKLGCKRLPAINLAHVDLS
jgi:hypothetical protein